MEWAAQSLASFLSVQCLQGSFLDIGCGSGLFSLAALNLGASRVVSFDYDADSVAACRELKQRRAPTAENWQITQGSALDPVFMQSLGQFEIVYSWGVLHHTGRMWDAIAAAAQRVAPCGHLYIAIYNTYSRSGWIARVKKFYCKSPAIVKRSMEIAYALRGIAMYLARLRNPFAEIRRYAQTSRGMSWWHDRVDWIGGYPYEHALPEEVFCFLQKRGFQLENLKTCNGGKGCNEFLFHLPPTKPDLP